MSTNETDANAHRITVTLPQLAQMIDHSLLHPTLTDAETLEGLAIARKYRVATACIKPYAIDVAKRDLAGSSVDVCAVIGFPHGNSTTDIKVAEATAAVKAGAGEIDMVINVGKALSGQWGYVGSEILAVHAAVRTHGALLKVIFENDFLSNHDIVTLCEMCSRLEVEFVKTSTGYGFVRRADGSYGYRGATAEHLRLMRAHCDAKVQVKAAGGVRTLDDLLHVRSLGVTRVGATATVAILEEAKKRGISDQPTTVSFKPMER